MNKTNLITIAAMVMLLFSFSARADEMTDKMCTVEADNMEQVAKDRDGKVPETNAHAQQNGAIDNEIIGLIYRTGQFSPAQERASIFQVCEDTDAFSADDDTILKAIRLSLESASP